MPSNYAVMPVLDGEKLTCEESRSVATRQKSQNMAPVCDPSAARPFVQSIT